MPQCPSVERLASEARIARAGHQDIIEELTTTLVLSGPSAFTSSNIKVISSHLLINCFVNVSRLKKSPPQFVYIYPDPSIQHDASTQADMFLACLLPKETKESEEDLRKLTVTALSLIKSCT